MSFTMSGLFDNMSDYYGKGKAALSSAFESEEEKKLKGGQSPSLDPKALGEQLQQKALEQEYGKKIDTSQQSKLHKREITDKQAYSVPGEFIGESDMNWKDKLAMLSQMTPFDKQKQVAPAQISTGQMSGAGRLGMGLSLAQILKYRP